MGKKFQMRTNLIENSSPPMQRTEISGGIRIVAIEPDGSKWRIEADRAIIESREGVNEKFETASGVTRIVCNGSVKLWAERGGERSQVTADSLELDLRMNSGWMNSPHKLP